MNFSAHLSKQFLFWVILAWMGGWLMPVPMQAAPMPKTEPPSHPPVGWAVSPVQPGSSGIVTRSSPQSPLPVPQIAEEITVKVMAGDTWGSGILIQQQGLVYTVVTNEHVLIAGDRYRVQTPDGRTHEAWVVRGDRFEGNDLGLLQFSSSSRYRIATLGTAASLQIGDALVASGFPVEASNASPRGFLVTTGQVLLLPNRTLQQGYQIGYSNAIQKGMSGGPVLNQQGQVVGINGRHAYPLWGDPFVFEDGSRPCPALQQRMVQLSWAIPTERFVQLAPRFANLVQRSRLRQPSETPIFCGQTKQIQLQYTPGMQSPVAFPTLSRSSQFL